MPRCYCFLCASDEGVFLEVTLESVRAAFGGQLEACLSKKVNKTIKLSNKICYKCAYELDQCAKFLQKSKKSYDVAKFPKAKPHCSLCCESIERVHIFDITEDNRSVFSPLQKIRRIFSEDLAKKVNTFKLVCLVCRYNLDVLYDLKKLHEQSVDSLEALVKKELDYSGFPKVYTDVVNRKTTITTFPDTTVYGLISSDSESSDEMARGKKRDKPRGRPRGRPRGKPHSKVAPLKNSSAKPKCRSCEQCSNAVANGMDMYRVHTTGQILCRSCWITRDPSKSTEKKQPFSLLGTKLCTVYLTDVMYKGSRDSGAYKVEKNKDDDKLYLSDESSPEEDKSEILSRLRNKPTVNGSAGRGRKRSIVSTKSDVESMPSKLNKPESVTVQKVESAKALSDLDQPSTSFPKRRGRKRKVVSGHEDLSSESDQGTVKGKMMRGRRQVNLLPTLSSASEGDDANKAVSKKQKLVPKETPKETTEESPKATKEPPKATTKESPKTTTKEPSKATTKEPPKATTKEPPKATTKEPPKATTKEPPKATTKEPSKTTTKAAIKETTKEAIKETTKEATEEVTKEATKEATKETTKEANKEATSETTTNARPESNDESSNESGGRNLRRKTKVTNVLVTVNTKKTEKMEKIEVEIGREPRSRMSSVSSVSSGKEATPPMEFKSPKEVAPQEYICDKCSKKFDTKLAQAEHKLTHNKQLALTLRRLSASSYEKKEESNVDLQKDKTTSEEAEGSNSGTAGKDTGDPSEEISICIDDDDTDDENFQNKSKKDDENDGEKEKPDAETSESHREDESTRIPTDGEAIASESQLGADSTIASDETAVTTSEVNNENKEVDASKDQDDHANEDVVVENHKMLDDKNEDEDAMAKNDTEKTPVAEKEEPVIERDTLEDEIMPDNEKIEPIPSITEDNKDDTNQDTIEPNEDYDESFEGNLQDSREDEEDGTEKDAEARLLNYVDITNDSEEDLEEAKKRKITSDTTDEGITLDDREDSHDTAIECAEKQQNAIEELNAEVIDIDELDDNIIKSSLPNCETILEVENENIEDIVTTDGVDNNDAAPVKSKRATEETTIDLTIDNGTPAVDNYEQMINEPEHEARDTSKKREVLDNISNTSTDTAMKIMEEVFDLAATEVEKRRDSNGTSRNLVEEIELETLENISREIRNSADMPSLDPISAIAINDEETDITALD